MNAPRLAAAICGIIVLTQSSMVIRTDALAGLIPDETPASRPQTHSENLAYLMQSELESKLTGVYFPNGYQPDQTIVFDYRPDSISSKYHIDIRIMRDEWRVYRLFSIPLVFNRYQNCYLLESRVTLKRDGSPYYEDRITIRKKGDPTFQLLFDEAGDPRVLMNHGRRLCLEKEARRELVRRIVNKLIKNIELQ